MANDVAIRVQGLGKRYRLGERRGSRTLREAIMDLGRVPGRMLRRRANGDDMLWALKDVDLEVRRGEVLGVIGRNGAGKTTLLKILSRITEPTTGRVELHGRVGSLLEVGTGFHPELTGRENIYLNGAILGMRKAEIDRKFDEIVAFAEIERFLDTPVKRYSSGMYVRLAFAVAAHLEPEILLVDEVLAVGDVGFQQRCLGKMHEVASGGRTVLFVSHNLASIQALTMSALHLEGGRAAEIGPTNEIVDRYINGFLGKVTAGRAEILPTPNDRHVLRRIEVLVNEKPYPVASFGSKLAFRIDYEAEPPVRSPVIGLGINTPDGHRVVSLNSRVAGVALPDLEGQGSVICDAGELPLNQGRYTIKVVLTSGAVDIQTAGRVCDFDVVPTDIFSSGAVPTAAQGVMVWPSRWRVSSD